MTLHFVRTEHCLAKQYDNMCHLRFTVLVCSKICYGPGLQESAACQGSCHEVVWEETTPKGPTSSKPMTLYELIYTIEKRGCLDYTITGHTAQRPPSVQRGEEGDRQEPAMKMVLKVLIEVDVGCWLVIEINGRIEVSHQSFAVYRPNPVTQKNAKGQTSPPSSATRHWHRLQFCSLFGVTWIRLASKVMLVVDVC